MGCERASPRGDAPQARRLPESERQNIAARAEERPAARPDPAPSQVAPAPQAPSTVDPEVRARLLDPPADERAPDTFTIVLDTTKGEVLIDVTRSWAPIGADRIYSMVRLGYFDDTAFFRVIEGFMAQVGIHGDPAVNRAWRTRNIQDEPVTQSNTAGMATFAKTGLPNSRSTQFFINFGDNARLDDMGFAPFGRVRDMSVMQQLYAGYGEGAPSGRGPAQARAQAEGNRYFQADFPEMDYIRTARIAEE